MEFHAVHADEHHLLPLPTCPADFVLCRHRSGQIEMAEDDAAENCTLRIGVGGHHDDLMAKNRSRARCRAWSAWESMQIF